MSPTIWTLCAGADNLRSLSARAWRVVEAQHVVATRKLVDSDAEQDLLEELIESAKPPRPRDPAAARLHYLLFTPFRYPPLPHGSRFGGRFTQGIWYGAAHIRTALAEKAYYTLLLLEGTTAAIGSIDKEDSAFRVRLQTGRGVDLVGKAFQRFRDAISSPTSYAESQALGEEMRAAGVQAFRYRSARDPEGGANLGVFSPRAFAARSPERPYQAWHCTASKARVRFRRRVGLSVREGFSFERGVFLVGGELPHPAI
jgi:hypothetical protein